jgi:hypothetical protein
MCGLHVPACLHPQDTAGGYGHKTFVCVPVQVYVLTKRWRFRAVTIAQYSQSQAGSRKRQRQRQQAADTAASCKAAQDVEAASHKELVLLHDDTSTHSLTHDGLPAGKPDAEQAAAELPSQQMQQELPGPAVYSADGSRRGGAKPMPGRVATIVPHPGGPGGKWELDSSRSLAASSTGSPGKTAVIVPEAARFAALKSATLWRQLVRRPCMLLCTPSAAVQPSRSRTGALAPNRQTECTLSLMQDLGSTCGTSV